MVSILTRILEKRSNVTQLRGKCCRPIDFMPYPHHGYGAPFRYRTLCQNSEIDTRSRAFCFYSKLRACNVWATDL